MLKQLYQFFLGELAGLERELFRESRDAARADKRGLTARFTGTFTYLASGIKYIFFQLVLALTELVILVVLPPKEGYDLLTQHRESGYSKSDLEAEYDRYRVRQLADSIMKRRFGKTMQYEEYEKRHKKARWVSLGTFSAAVAAVVAVSLVVNLILPLAPNVLGATYTFTQTGWGGGATANNAAHPTNQSGWSQYSSKSADIAVVNGGADLEIASTTASVAKTSDTDFAGGTSIGAMVSGSGAGASVTLKTATSTSDTDFAGGTFTTATTTGTGAGASVKLSDAPSINEYTIGALSNIAVTASSVTANDNGTWTMAFSGTPALTRIFKNDKFVDSAGKAWKILSVFPASYKIIVVDSERNLPTVSAPAGTGNGTVGRWYASIYAWEAGRNTDITATGRNSIERGLPYYDGAPDTTPVSINGWTTDATHYVEIYVPLSERHRGKWDTNKYRLMGDGGGSTGFLTIAANHVRISGLQLQVTSSYNIGIYVVSPTDTADVRLSYNIIKGSNGKYQEGIEVNGSASSGTYKIYVWNNIIYDFALSNDIRTGNGILTNSWLGSGYLYAYNNTIYNCYKGYYRYGTGISFLSENNIYQSNSIAGTDGFVGAFAAGSTNNLSDIASDAPGTNPKTGTVPFVDAANGDFHLEFRDGTGNPARDAGADLSADANLPFNTDIDGDTRAGTWDIGADDIGTTLVMTHSIGTASRDFSTLQAWEDARDGVLTTRNVFRATLQNPFTEGETITGASGATGTYIKEEATPASSLKGTYNTPDYAYNVSVSGNYAYVADGTSGLQIVNISSSTAPTLTGTYNTTGVAYDVVVSGNYAYVGDGASGLQIINISNPVSPTLTGTYDTPDDARGLSVSGNYAYVGDGASGLQIVNISNPASPTLAGSYDTTGTSTDAFISGNYAYVVDGTSGLQIINVSNPASPTLAGSYDTTGTSYNVFVSGNYAYVGDGASGLQIINISSSTSPTLTGTYNTVGTSYNVSVSGNYAYVADGTVGGLQIINISNPASPTFAGSYDTTGSATDVDVSGGYAYVADGASGLQVIKPLEYFTVDKLNGTAFVAGELLTGGTSGATTTLSTILTTAGTIEKGEAYNDSTFTAGVGIGGSTTDASHYMWLTVEPRSRHTGVAGTGAKITDTSIINNTYTKFEWFVINVSGLTTTGINLNSAGDSSNSEVSNNIIYKNAGTGYQTSYGLNPSSSGIIKNNFIYGFDIGIYAYGVSAYNNTIISNVTGIFRAGSTPAVINNIVVGNTTDYNINAGSWSGSSSNNISSDATAPGTGSLTNKAVGEVKFVSTTAGIEDFHIMHHSIAKDAGADLSATFTGDVDGQTRATPYDIGADEWQSSRQLYNTSGSFESATLDLGGAADFSTANFSETLTAGGVGKAFGANAFGQLGDGTTATTSNAVTVAGLSNVAAVAAGGWIINSHSLALLSDGTVKTWGSNNYGQLGNGTTNDSTTPVSVSGITTAVAIAAGGNHSLALLSNGTVKAWGYNNNNQLGDGTTTQRNAPVTVCATGAAAGTCDANPLSNVVAISVGINFSIALLSNGTVKAWGNNANGSIGDGTTISKTTPVTVCATGAAAGTCDSNPLSSVVAISGSYYYHSLAVLSNGTVKAWGYNSTGNLGDGTTTQRTTPVTVCATGAAAGTCDTNPLSSVVAIAAGNSQSIALLSNGTMKGWGDNGSGRLGDGTTTQRNTPVTVCATGASAGTCDTNPLSSVVAIAAGNGYTLALLSTGIVKAWGVNSNGQYGDGTTNTSFTPVSALGVANATAIAAGEAHSLVVTGGMRASVAAKNADSGWVASDYKPLMAQVGTSLKKAVIPLSNGNRYIRYKVNLSTADSAFSPQLDDVAIKTSSGTFESPTIDLGGPVSFGTLNWNPAAQATSTGMQFAVAAKNTDSGWQDSDYVELNREAYPTGVTVHTSYVRPSGQCGSYSPCYNTLSAWEAAQNRDLTALNEIEVAQIGGSWTSPDTTAVTINGWTTDATHYIKIYTMPEARHSGKWDTGKYRLESSAIAVQLLAIVSNYTKITGLQFRLFGADGGNDRYAIIIGANTTGTEISKNILKDESTGTASVHAGIVQYNTSNFTVVTKIWNNIVYGFKSGISVSGAPNIFIYNNTAYNISAICYSNFWQANAATFKNNIAQNCTDGFGTYSSAASDYNISDLTSDAPGANSKNSTIVSFVNATSGDFHLASFDIAAKNAGADLTNDANLTVKTDIEGHLRPTGAGTWDIGASEYGATGGNIPASLNGNRYIRYKVNLSTADLAFSPQLDDVTVNYYYYNSGLTIDSSPYNSADSTNILGKVAWTASTTASTDIRIRVRSAPNNGGVPGSWSTWCGPTACNGSDYFSTANNGVDLASSHPLKNGGDDQWLQYRISFISSGYETPTFHDITLTYVVNAPPDFDATYGTNGVSVAQNTSDGKVTINYKARDVDTTTGTVTPNYITPSFAYSVDGGSNWVSITSGYLSAGDLSNKGVNNSTYTQYSATWDAKAQIPGTSTTTAKIMVTATDNEGANNTASAISGTFALDEKNPTASVTVDGTKSGLSGAVSITSSDNSSYQMMLSNNSDFSADGLNASSGQWTATSTSPVWNFASAEPVKVYAKFRDDYQNETSVAPDAPSTPANVIIRDTSDLALSEFREFVAWDVNIAGDFASYKVYRSTDGSSYSLANTIASSATNFITDGSSGAWLSNGTTYYYKLTAQDTSGNISRYSSAVSDQPNGQGGTDVTPPTISALSVSATSTTQATITWTTDELANGTVYYSTDTSYGSSKAVASMAAAHSVTLAGLTPNTTYNFRVRSTDPSGNISSYATGTPFMTAQGAVISGVTAVSVTGNSATIVWNTNADSNSFVVYSTNSDLSGAQMTGTSTFVGGAGPNHEHRVSLIGLTTNAQYYYKVRSTDIGANMAEDNNGGTYYTFSTAQDVTAPVISGVSAALASQTSAVISWTTDELSDSQVIYGTDPSSMISQTAVSNTMTISHSMVVNNLIAGTKYYYKVVSADSSGNSTQSSVYDFSTTAQALQDIMVVTRYTPDVERDRTPPILSDVTISDIGQTSAVVAWGTDEDASSFAEHGETELFGMMAGRFESLKIHNVTLRGLTPNVTYYLKAMSQDSSGNLGTSKLVSFKTLPMKTQEEQTAEAVKNIAKTAGETKSVAQLTKEVETLLADLATKVSPPKITGAEPQVELTSSFAVISWSTDRPANSMVAFASDKDYLPNADDPYQVSVGNSDEQVTDHKVTLTDLAPGATYHFQVRSKGVVGGVGVSRDFTFKTGEEASISGVEVKEITKDSSTILWRTNIPASTLLEYGMSTAYGSRQNDPAFNTSHIAILKNLDSGTFYHFKISGQDKNSNLFASPDLTFTTESLPSLLNVKIDSVKEKEIKVIWYTNVLADSTVEYTNLKTDKTETFGDKQLVRNHDITVTGLAEDAPYKFNVVSKDDKGNEVKSSTYNFQTTRDREAPAITNIQIQSAVSGKDKVQTIVSWKTSEPASSRVAYQEGVIKKPELERTSPLDNDLKTNHIMVFTDFKPGAVYRLRIESVDASNNAGESRDLTILTPQQKETVVDLIIKNFQDIFRWTRQIK